MATATDFTRQPFLKMWMDVLPAGKVRSGLRQQFSSPLLALMAIVGLVMREVLLLAAVGVAVGAPAAWAVTRLVGTQLFGIQPTDALTMAAAAIRINSVAALSGYLPARRATRIDPMRALRWE